MIGILIKRGNFGHRDRPIQRKQCEETSQGVTPGTDPALMAPRRSQLCPGDFRLLASRAVRLFSVI